MPRRGAVRIAPIALAVAGLAACGREHLAFRTPPGPQPATSTASAPPAPTPREALAVAATAGEESVPEDPELLALDRAVNDAVAAGKLPGCVVVAGRGDEVRLRRAYGSRALLPERTPMTAGTVFDLASLTKPLATATSIMILVDRGKVDLAARASRYVPELAKLPPFTVEQLLLHTSGLPAATPLSDYAADRLLLFQRLGELTLKSKPGERFLYSDVGFVVLEEIVRRTSGKDLASFVREEIFAPLGMSETGYLPDAALRARAAPTEQREGAWMLGEVHDPRAFALGGVAGHAGVFSTADDLARFAQAMLREGAAPDGRRLLSKKAFTRMISRRDTSSGGRALGWDVDSRFATHRSPRLSARAFGHGGFTGTALWIDPGKDVFVVFLSNRVHPNGTGSVNALAAEVATHAVDAMEVRSGIDVLRTEGFRTLQGAKIGLVTNASARSKDGATTIDVLRAAPGVTLAAVFSPEHGLSANREGKIGDASYAGVPVYSLYGERWSPTAESLSGIDTLVFDLQDAGARFYTYASTMKLAMRVAAERKLRFVVLDRPNPLGGIEVAGPVLDPSRASSFVNHHALPVRHGMTMGELARLFASDDGLDLRLDVVTMQGWRRKDYFDRTGLAWSAPSPNLRTVEQAVLYPMVGLLEATNLSVGRGTPSPFEVIGAPFVDGAALATKLASSGVAGVSFEATTFTPSSAVHAGKRCGGVRVRVTDRATYEPVRGALAIAQALRENHPQDWDGERLDRMLQSTAAMDAFRRGLPPDEIASTWAAELAAFRKKRASFLLYR